MRILRPSFSIILMLILLAGCGGGGSSQEQAAKPLCSDASGHVCTVLFVGDSFTHGRYLPVRLFNGQSPGEPWQAPQVIDENYGQTGDRAESKSEYGPWGGIPGIFSELAQQMNLNYEVHLEAISATSLEKNLRVASDVIEQTRWQAIVLQELSIKPLPKSLTKNDHSDPPGFWASVNTIEEAVHAIAPQTAIFLYEPWPGGDLAQELAGDPKDPDFHQKYMQTLNEIGDATLASYQCAALRDGQVAGVAPVGEAWRRVWSEGLANPDPFQPSTLPILWYGINAVNDPSITKPDYHHPGIYGAYISGLVLFVQMTGKDVRKLGAREHAAARLGISGEFAAQLQKDAWQTVRRLRHEKVDEHADPCALVDGTE